VERIVFDESWPQPANGDVSEGISVDNLIEQAIMFGALLALGVQKIKILDDEHHEHLKFQISDSAARLGVYEPFDELDRLRGMDGDRAMPVFVALKSRLTMKIQSSASALIAEWFEFSLNAMLLSTMPEAITGLRGDLKEQGKRIGLSANSFAALLRKMEQGGEGVIEILLEQAKSGVRQRQQEATANVPSVSRKVFVAHGHDEAAREKIARFLARLEFEPVILHEQASLGRTVIEKVEAHSEVGFAVVLLTPDDEGCKKGGTPRPRARQNVVLELGFFIGRLGRTRVCALKRGEVEIPSDFEGIVYVGFDDADGWKQALGRELEAAGFEINWNKAMGAEA
jgi:predicted nucleotide-binding protein